MRLLIHKNYEDLCRWTADYIANRITDFNPQKDKPFVLGLPTGSSPLGVYRELIGKNREGKLSFKNVITFNMDEYIGLPPNNPQSYRFFINENLFKHVDVCPENTHIPNGMASDPEAECRSYEEKIIAVGGIELFFGGMGHNGHLAFNEPGSSLVSRTRAVKLNHETREANARFFSNDKSHVPATAMTVGLGTVMDAREVLVIVSGHGKARSLAAAVEDGVSEWVPVSCLQTHPRAIIACDEDAAGDLKYSTVQHYRDAENR